jgi:hypothetical protein
LQVFHAKWHNRLLEGESSEGCDVIAELRGVASSLTARKTGLRSKCIRRVCGNGMKKCSGGMKSRGSGTKQCGSRTTSTLRPSLSSKLSFRLVDLTISFSIEHLAILSKLIHCIATCIANGTIARNSCAIVPTSPTTTSLWVASWSSDMFPIFRVFRFLYFHLV